MYLDVSLEYKITPKKGTTSIFFLQRNNETKTHYEALPLKGSFSATSFPLPKEDRRRSTAFPIPPSTQPALLWKSLRSLSGSYLSTP